MFIILSIANSLFLTEISDREVMEIICSLNKSNAKDNYGFDTNFLKLHMKSLVFPIMQLINLSIRHSVVLTNWKVGIVNPRGELWVLRVRITSAFKKLQFPPRPLGAGASSEQFPIEPHVKIADFTA